MSIASPVDLRLQPLVPRTPGGLYRTSEVTILCRSQAQLERDLAYIIDDVRSIMRLQRRQFSSFEVEVIEDVPLPK